MLAAEQEAFRPAQGWWARLRKHHRLYGYLSRSSKDTPPTTPWSQPTAPVERSQGNCFPVQWKEAVAAAVADAVCLYPSSLAALFPRQREVTALRSGFLTHRITSKPLPCFERKKQEKLPLAAVCSNRCEIKPSPSNKLTRRNQGGKDFAWECRWSLTKKGGMCCKPGSFWNWRSPLDIWGKMLTWKDVPCQGQRSQDYSSFPQVYVVCLLKEWRR